MHDKQNKNTSLHDGKLPTAQSNQHPKWNKSNKSSSNNKFSSTNVKKDGYKQQKLRCNSEYQSITFTERKSSGRPGSPHRFFESSYDAALKHPLPSLHECGGILPVGNTEESSGTRGNGNTELLPTSDKGKTRLNSGSSTSNDTGDCCAQVVHRHANGLCVVTAGNTVQKALLQQPTRITGIEFRIEETKSTLSVGGKRKKARMMQGNGTKKRQKDDAPGTVHPTDVIAVVTLSDGREVEVRACVSGTVIEINRRLVMNPVESSDCDDASSSLVVKDPLLDGYFAVIMPNGKFPPLT